MLVLQTTQPPLNDSTSRIDNLCRAITDKDYKVRRNVAVQERLSHLDNKPMCDKLLDIINNDKSTVEHSPKEIALYVMSNHVDYQSEPHIIKALIDNINVHYNGSNSNRSIEAFEVSHPAIRGLLLIGERATLPILERIKSTDDPDIHSKLGYWFYKYYGKRMAIRYFNDLLDEDPKMPAEVRKRLVHVLEKLEKPSW